MGKEHGIARGAGGYDYVQSNEASEYTTNVNGAVQMVSKRFSVWVTY